MKHYPMGGSLTQKSALVLGGGIAGIQASIDLAGMGIKVYLVEKKPSIGGRMAQLDKTFPTNDCAMCILAPKMIECANHENIQVLTYSELADLAGEPGKFKARITRKARYVEEDKCVGCGDCATVCPVRIADDFNGGLGQRGHFVDKECRQGVKCGKKVQYGEQWRRDMSPLR
ncbi:unnamed protein product [marine sediment metagenome]|uniref:4Fe-4S ferredoxin-type domain-containing protein n=1 Tax=marine sediment metagenome TaxID=412755 RepID=X1E9G7_9ZZZZ